MGRQDVAAGSSSRDFRHFTRRLLEDLRALDTMIERGQIESDVRRIGAEQEVFLVDSSWRPAPLALEILEELGDPHFKPEIGLFNLEFNLDPIRVGERCLSELEAALAALLERLREAAAARGALVVLTGILPTIDKSDLRLASMTPLPRYRELNDALNRQRGESYSLRIKGRDELIVTHDNVMLEACNTSFQVHFQVSPENFASRYNAAQAAAAPVLAAATNSPLLFGRQLWRETRIALLQQSIDTRAPSATLRQETPRVSFGRSWVEESVIEIFQEDIARFRVLMSAELGEEPAGALEQGRAPALDALCLFNGTVYRWNRPCYGVSEGRPHLRIENRVLPSGPTPLDEVANAAFWFGLVNGLTRTVGDIRHEMEFEQAHENFVAASRLGLGAHLTWPGRGTLGARRLILEELLPLAGKGLDLLGVASGEIDNYLGVIAKRVESRRTGSQWAVDSLARMAATESRSEPMTALVAATCRRQAANEPVHRWEEARLEEAGESKAHYHRVDQVMTTDLFTVHRDEPIDIAACVMTWRHIRHVPVEDDDRRLVGLVTHRSLLKLLASRRVGLERRSIPVSEIMQTELVTAHPETSCLEAIERMRRNRVSCLPVVDHRNRLVGILSERDFMGIAGRLLERYLGD